MLDIFSYIENQLSDTHGEKLSQLKEMVADYGSFITNDSMNKESRAKLKVANRICIDVWRDIFYTYEKTKDKEKTLLILFFGIFDFNLQFKDEKEIENTLFLLDIYESSDTYMDLLVWFRAIWTKSITTSMDDKGLSYKDTLVKNNKMVKDMEQAKAHYMNEDPKKLIDWEVEKIFVILNRMNFFNRNNLYMAHNLTLRMSVDRAYLSKKKLDDFVNQIERIDFGLFFRDVLVSFDQRIHSFKARVKPYFIYLPIAADKMVMYQSLTDRDGQKRGRIFVPTYFNGDNILKELAYTLGLYRWDIAKWVSGVHWMDPVDGKLTGKFYDFYEFCHKRIKDEDYLKYFQDLKAKHRNNIARVFADLYTLWIMKESNNSLVLYKDIREIFWEFITFSKRYRSFLEKNIQHSMFIQRTYNVRKEKLRMEKLSKGSLNAKNDYEEKLFSGNFYYWEQ